MDLYSCEDGFITVDDVNQKTWIHFGYFGDSVSIGVVEDDEFEQAKFLTHLELDKTIAKQDFHFVKPNGQYHARYCNINFIYNPETRIMTCSNSLDSKTYDVEILTKYQKWSDLNPGPYIKFRMYAFTNPFSHLSYIYYNGSTMLSERPQIDILLPKTHVEEFQEVAKNYKFWEIDY